MRWFNFNFIDFFSFYKVYINKIKNPKNFYDREQDVSLNEKKSYNK